MVKAALILALLALLTACATPAPSPVADPRAVWCAHNEPRRPTAESVAEMARAELDQVNSHNGKGELWCGWKP